jgi:hypothetical protein
VLLTHGPSYLGSVSIRLFIVVVAHTPIGALISVRTFVEEK